MNMRKKKKKKTVIADWQTHTLISLLSFTWLLISGFSQNCKHKYIRQLPFHFSVCCLVLFGTAAHFELFKMGDTQHSQPDQAAKLAAQKKLMESVITALRDNHDALSFLPDMMERFLEMCETGVGKKAGANNVDVSRYRWIFFYYLR